MEESYQDRQENEKSSLKAIYGEQISIILPRKNDEWKPLECFISLTAQMSFGTQTFLQSPQVELHIKCPFNYPDCIPDISVNKVKGLSNENADKLIQELRTLSERIVGEVMIFELAQYTEKFLHQYKTPGYESFYEEMISRKRGEKELELQKKLDNEMKEREVIMHEIYSKQQAVKKALRKYKNSSSYSDISNDHDESLPKCDGEVVKSAEHKNRDNFIKDDEEWKMGIEDYTPWTMYNAGQSRFDHEFEYIKWLGRGAFGDVIKVRNKLDDGFYAVKRIPLKAANKQLNKRITREVKLLSRLNHENVVRYYNSWIESVDLPVSNKSESEESPKKQTLATAALAMLPKNEAISFDWNVSNQLGSGNNCEDDDDEDDSWISFKIHSNEDEDQSLSQIDMVDSAENSTKSMYMYIQMELCEKNTLRTAIDQHLYDDSNRVWRLFREIIEGLSHIHQQGIIHRDLKPVNIFIGHGDRVKIGDFGLATTIILHKQTVPREYNAPPETAHLDKHEGLPPPLTAADLSHTGHVGTALYIAPELDVHESKLSYNEKVDIYSLGIIFFEMCHPPWSTKMEQFKVISDLRQRTPTFPKTFPHDSDSQQHLLIKWMLNYNPKERPTSHELLSSKYIPPPQLEEAEMKEMVKRTLSNPQSKHYKHLIASCFNQTTPAVIDATFDMSSGHSERFMLLLESTADLFRKVFLRHGAISVMPPLFTPGGKRADTAVCLMARWGGIIFATHDLRTPFARYLARNSHLQHIKRYAIDKVYRERRVLGLHPKEIYECAFDIVTPTTENLLPECELIFVVWEILSEFPTLLSKNCCIRLNHSLIIEAVLRHCGFESSTKMTATLFKVKNEFDSRNDMPLPSDLPDNIKSLLLNILTIEGSLEEVKLQLLSIIKEDALISLCLQAFNQLQCVINYSKTLGIKLNFSVSMCVVQNAHQFSGLMFQLVTDQKDKFKNISKNILISGGRYDHLIQTCRLVQLVSKEVSQCVAGFCLSIDKFISCLTGYKRPAAFDVLVCTIGQSQITTDKLYLIRDLWKCGIRTSFTHSTQSLEELQNYCLEFSIAHIVILKDSDAKGFVRIRSWNKEKFNERKILLSELVDYLIKVVKNSSNEQSTTKIDVKASSSVENANITFISMEKLSLTSKKRYETQVMNSLAGTCEKLSNKAKLEIIGLFLESDALKMLAYCTESESPDQEMNNLIKKYPRHKKYVVKILDQLLNIKKTENAYVLILYSLIDNIFKVIL